ncbi:MAG: PhzF family phenazine biosynthesis protein, partial [Puniceicoccales bacterium]
MRLPLFQLDAFAEKQFQGNPAAVCPLETWLPDELLQAIAAENNLSETAFYVQEADGFRIRWFTPNKEVDLCGHATLAAAYVLRQQMPEIGPELTFHSRSGALRVTESNGLLTLDFPAQVGVPASPPAILREALGVNPLD